MGNHASIKSMLSPRFQRTRKISRKSSNSFQSKSDSLQRSESSMRSERSSRSEYSSSSDNSNGNSSSYSHTDLDGRGSNLSAHSDGAICTVEELPNKRHLYRTYSCRETNSEPRRSHKKRDEESEEKKRHTQHGKRVVEIIRIERTLMNLYKIAPDKPFQLKLIPLFIIDDNIKETTVHTLTVRLKLVPKKCITEDGHMYEADISFSEGKMKHDGGMDRTNDSNSKRAQLVRAYTWTGKTHTVLLTEAQITFLGHFHHPEYGSIDYLGFELVLTPICKHINEDRNEENSSISKSCTETRMVDKEDLLDSCRDTPNAEPKEMTGVFTFSDNRTSRTNEFKWHAVVLRSIRNKDFIHSLPRV